MTSSSTSNRYDWHGFHDFAEEICELDEKDETSYRVAMGRLYYSAFNIVREYARDRYGFWSDSDVHASLIEFLSKNGYDEYDSFSRDLRFLRDSHTSSDYVPENLEDPVTRLHLCRAMANRLIDFVDNASA